MTNNQNFTEKPPRTRNKKAKIDSIVETTKKMIEEKGYMETNTNRIAEAAGVSIGLIYKYFPGGKAHIAHEISLRYHSPIADSIQSINMGEITKPGFRKKLIHTLLDWIEIHRRNAQFIRAMDIATLLNPFLHKGTAEMVRRTAEKGQPFLWPEEAPDDAELKELTFLLFHTVESVVLRHVTAMQVCDSDQQLAEFLADVVIGAILYRLNQASLRSGRKAQKKQTELYSRA
jgi:AcrR family transcriptional regulator